MEIEEVVEEIVAVPPEPRKPIIVMRSQPAPPPSFPPDSAVYVAVSKKKSSMNALSWVLRHEACQPSSKVVYLIHIFPEVRHIPTPLGNLQKCKVNPEQIEAHMITVRSKRRELLHKLINLCYSAKVEVDTILIESDEIAKAVLDLIPVLQIPTLVIGASKSSAKKLKRGGGEKEEQMLKGAPDYCKVKVISEGKEIPAAEILDHMSTSPSPSTPPSISKSMPTSSQTPNDENRVSAGCGCFLGISRA